MQVMNALLVAADEVIEAGHVAYWAPFGHAEAVVTCPLLRTNGPGLEAARGLKMTLCGLIRRNGAELSNVEKQEIAGACGYPMILGRVTYFRI
jgi:hypothetical protein